MSLRVIMRALAAMIAVACTGAVAPVSGLSMVAAQPAVADPFYQYDGADPLSSYEPGAVLKTRTVPYNFLNVPTPLQAVQVLYRSTDALGRPSANVTSVLKPLTGKTDKVISYQSFYDSLNPDDSPSRAIAGNAPIADWTPSGRNFNIGGTFTSIEAPLFAPLFAQGYAIVIPDTEGPHANFAAGPEYGKMTLDSLRAAFNAPETGLAPEAKIGLMGYSGGAIASNWAAILAPDYAPDINKNLIGVAQGGLLVNPATNLKYASGSLGWGGVVGMAVVGIARSYEIDFGPYITERGREIMARLEDASIGNVLMQYPGLTWQELVKPEYANPNTIPEFVDVVNKINMGTAPIPTIPMFVAQATNGIIEGTQAGAPGIGAGDAIMVAGDVRSLMNRYCEAGLEIQYDQYDLLSHIPGAMLWLPGALMWLNDRFNGVATPSNCGSIALGNSLEPQYLVIE
ncbi:MAG: lipase family protein [Mycobacteriaceae bacterium]